MQTRDEVEGLHNSRVYIRLCKHGKRFLLLKEARKGFLVAIVFVKRWKIPKKDNS